MNNQLARIAVYDGFDGLVKIVRKKNSRMLIEIIDVNMCYHQQRQLMKGEQIWIETDDIYSLNILND